MKEYEYHPFADAFPMMTDQEHHQLVADIKANGLREPITRYQGKLLDGRNRDRVCDELGIKPIYVDFEGTDQEALAFVISMNLVRRHLTIGQLGLIAAELATLRQGQHKAVASIEATQADTAKLMHISRTTVQRARKLREKGTPEQIEAVRQGVSISKVVKQIDEVDADLDEDDKDYQGVVDVVSEAAPVGAAAGNGHDPLAAAPANAIAAARPAQRGKTLFLIHADDALSWAVFTGKVDKRSAKAARATATAWSRLARRMETAKKVNKAEATGGAKASKAKRARTKSR
jgi:hypothetical protein